MSADEIRSLLKAVQSSQTTVEEALARLRLADTEDLGFARLDHQRYRRQGLAEVVYAEGKLPEETASIVKRLWQQDSPVVIASRVDQETSTAIQLEVPEAVYHPRCQLVIAQKPKAQGPETLGEIVVVAAGTSDLAVAEEAFFVAEALGNPSRLIVDVGVAGIHRLFEVWPSIASARVLIVVAGMEGALASVVGGLANGPVLAVPSPVGYGAAQGGLTALQAMLSSCALGVGVFNIGNGIGAAVLATKINQPKR